MTGYGESATGTIPDFDWTEPVFTKSNGRPLYTYDIHLHGSDFPPIYLWSEREIEGERSYYYVIWSSFFLSEIHT